MEKEPVLGGQLLQLKRSLDNRLLQDLVEDLRAKIAEQPLISVLTGCEVIEQHGFVGSFETEIVMPSGATRSLKHGAIIIATGAEEFRPELYGLDEVAGVVTQTDFEKLLEEEELTGDRPHVVMLQCAGSRDVEQLPYCSRVCCNQAVKNSLSFVEKYPQGRVDVLYRDMRCYGLGELEYRKARQAGVNFIRFDPATSPPTIDSVPGAIKVAVLDPSIRRMVELEPDILVLSTGMKPRDTEELASMLRVPRNDQGFFIEAHAKLRPVDLPSEGLFMAGTAHGPKSCFETIVQAQAAVARATTLLSKKSMKMSAIVSIVDPTNCAVCLTCVRACPYGVPFINDQHSAEINPALCQGCGICVAECPAKTIHMGRFEDSNIRAKLESYSAT